MLFISGIMPELLAIDQLFHYFIFFSIGASPVTFSIIEKKNLSKNLPWVIVGSYWIIFAILVISYKNLISHLGIIDTRPGIVFIIEQIFCIIWGIAGAYGSILMAKAIASNKRISNNPAIRLVKDNSFKLYRYSDPFNYLVIYISTTTGLLLISHPIGAPVHCVARFLVTILAPILIILVQRYLRNRTWIPNRTIFAFPFKRNSTDSR